jgi:putative ABC transport system permease protein
MYERLPRGVRRLLRLPQSSARLMADLDDEIRFHLETRIDAFVARGMSLADARAAALARFGDADDVRRHYRSMSAARAWRADAVEWLTEWSQDVRFAVRQFSRAPAFTAITVIMLALGIGANTALFSVVHHLILNPLPFPDGDRLVSLTATGGGGRVLIQPTQHMAESWRQRTRVVERVALAQEGALLLGDSTTGRSEDVGAMAVQPQVFALAPVRPILGRNIVGDDTLVGAPPVAVIGYRLWAKTFGRSPAVLGRVIHLSDHLYTIVGVMPPGYAVPFNSENNQVFTALQSSIVDRPIFVIGKLRKGVTRAAADRELAMLFPPRSVENPGSDAPRTITSANLASRSLKTMVLILFAAVSCVLLIVCANVANLALVRSWSRQREFAIRAALGAGRGRLGRQVFTESLLLALAGGAAGIGTAVAGLHIIIAAQPASVSDLDGVRIEPAVLAWAFGISVIAAVVFGLAPALFAANDRVGEALKTGTRTAAGNISGRRLRGALVIVEVSLSVVLLAGAGLLIRTLTAFERLDVGMNAHGLVGIQLQWPTRQQAPDPVHRRAALSGMLRAVQGLPGVEAATFAAELPPGFGIAMGRLEIDGRQTAPGDALNLLGYNDAGPDFFRTVGIPVEQGRVFGSTGSSLDAAGINEVVINERLARRFWPKGGALGARIRRGNDPWSTVVGIVGDVRLPSLALGGRELQMYMPMRFTDATAMLVDRSTLPLAALTKTLTTAIHETDASIIIRGDPTTAEAIVSAAMDRQRFVLALLGAFATLALILAAVGLHGVIAYGVTQRTREIGVRIALGARKADVLRLVVSQGLVLVLTGVVTGVGTALVATRALASLLFGVQPGDPTTLTAVAVLSLVAAIIASYGPARRAAMLDPIDALRAD